MEYSINPAALTAVFIVPSDVVDKHIKLAGAYQLKVLLFVMRNMSDKIDPEKLSEALGITVPDVKDALYYWVEAGIVRTSTPENGAAEESTPAIEAKKAAKAEEPVKPKSIKPAQVKPSREDIAKRGSESPEIALLLKEAQMKFGRGLRQNEASSLVWLHDDEGMGVALILMLIEFTLSEGKCNIGFIERTAIDWINCGITNITEAEAKICEIHNQRTAWRKVESAMGIDRRLPSKKELQTAYKWVDEWGFSKTMLRAAYEKCVDTTSKFSIPYVHKILEGWHKSGVKKPEDIDKTEADDKKTTHSKKKKPSYAGFDDKTMDILLNSND